MLDMVEFHQTKPWTSFKKFFPLIIADEQKGMKSEGEAGAGARARAGAGARTGEGAGAGAGQTGVE